MSLQWNLGQRPEWAVRMKRGFRTNNQGFTLMQVLVAVVLVLVIASIAAMAYKGLLDDARAAACENNLKVLNTAVELYADDYGVIPAVLGDLELEHLTKAYARVVEKNGWQFKFFLALLKLSRSDEAWAEFLTYENLAKFGAAKDSFSCPGDKNGGTSYGINANLAGMLWAKVGGDVVVVGDCDSPTFTSAAQLNKRHVSGKVALAMTKGGAVVEMGDASVAATGTGGTVPTFDVDADAVADADHDDDSVANTLSDILAANEGTTLGDRVQQILDKLVEADAKWAASQNQGAISELEAAVGVLDSALSDGLLDTAQAREILAGLAVDAKRIVVDIIDAAMSSGGNAAGIANAQQDLADGDALRGSGAYGDAVSKYKQAAAAAESAMP